MTETIGTWFATQRGGVNLQVLYEHLVAEHGFVGSYKSIQRFVRRHYLAPKFRTRRRVETPPGAQAQADWGEFRGLRVGGEAVDLYAFHLVLSHPRAEAVGWSPRKDQLAWLAVRNAAFERLGGTPAVVLIDNERTAIARGTGAWGEPTVAYQSYAQAMPFHIDAAGPRQPQAKGKVRELEQTTRGPRRA